MLNILRCMLFLDKSVFQINTHTKITKRYMFMKQKDNYIETDKKIYIKNKT